MALRFTKQEDELIIQNAPNMTAKELAELLPIYRDTNSVYQRAYRLDVELKKVDRAGIWDSDEEQIIIDNGHLGYPALSKLLSHRNASAIKTHAQIMGVRIKKTYTYKPKTILPKSSTPKNSTLKNTYSGNWTFTDIKILRHFADLPIMELCLLIPRQPAEQIARMKNRLELE